MSGKISLIGMNFLNPLSPASVRHAGIALYASLALSVASDVLVTGLAAASPEGVWSGQIYVIIFMNLIVLFVYGCTVNGRNWARILTTLVLIPLIGTVGSDFQQIGHHRGSEAGAVLDTLSLLLHAYALYLLWTKPGSEWFRAERVKAPS